MKEDRLISLIHKDQLILNQKLLQQFQELDLNYFPWPWRDSELVNFLKKPTAFALAVVRDECILGFLLGEILSDLGQFHLYKILVHPDFRMEGHARDLMRGALRSLYYNHNITEIYLEVSSNNHSAIKLYREFGLRMIHRKKKFYSDGSDADIMLGAIGEHLFS